MGYCSSCGLPVPEGQKVYSMCYGDPCYGRDGYYQQRMDQQEAERQARDQERGG